MNKLLSISVSGFKSLRRLNKFEAGDLNVLIGPNGCGKSNFIDVFRFLNNMVERNLQVFIRTQGGADSILYFGHKETESVEIALTFGMNGYSCSLVPTKTDSLVFADERASFQGQGYDRPYEEHMGAGHEETRLHEQARQRRVVQHVVDYLMSCIVYHFHDTSSSARLRKTCDVNDNRTLRPDASNLAAFLYYLREVHSLHYRNIVDTVHMVAPFFKDFVLEPSRLSPQKIQLEWSHTGSDAYFNAGSLSDGSLRFICLATLLLQPTLPSTILLDEPELGLHPHAIGVVSEMLSSAADKTQLIVSTQSVTLVNQLQPKDLVVVDRVENATVLRRIDKDDMTEWLEDYGLGDLWEKNLLGGTP